MPQRALESAHDLVDVDRHAVNRLLLPEREKLLGEKRGPLRALRDLVEVRGRGMAGRDPSAGEIGKAQHHRKHVVEVMGDAAGEASHRFHPLGLCEPGLQPAGFADVSLDARDERRIAGRLGRQEKRIHLHVDDLAGARIAHLHFAVEEALFDEAIVHDGPDEARTVLGVVVAEGCPRDVGIRSDPHQPPAGGIHVEHLPLERCDADEVAAVLDELEEQFPRLHDLVQARAVLDGDGDGC